MIQRRQTLYLLLIVILGIVLYFLPVLQFTTPDREGIPRLFDLGAYGLRELTEEYSYVTDLPAVVMKGIWGLTVTTLIMPLLALVIIFLYRHRMVQARLCILLFLLCLGYYGVLLIYAWFGKHNIAHEWSVLFGSCIPLICAVLTAMAARRILKDEALVRSADRLR